MNHRIVDLYWAFALIAILAISIVACSDDEVEGDAANASEDDCEAHEVWNPIDNLCVPSSSPPNNTTEAPAEDAGVDAADATTSADDDAALDDDENSEASGNASSCEGQACQQVNCGSGESPTRLTGTVTIPSGELPLPDVAVYVPNSPLEPIGQGATCEQCQDELGADPLVSARTNAHGHFRLDNVPVGDEIPLVIEVGKWRRKVTIPYVEECETTEVDADLLRLPRNQDEGDIPQIAMTTGGWDAMECLMRKIGVSASEFSTEEGSGRVHLFAGRDGTNRFDNSLNSGASLTPAWDWWDDLDNLLKYDIIIHSCEGQPFLGDKSSSARHALQDFTDVGGRVFLSHYHYTWLEHGPDDFQSVADWGGMAMLADPETGYINTSFDKGALLYDWMNHTGSDVSNGFPIHEARGSVTSLNEELAQEWVWVEPDDPPFSFPGMAEQDDEITQYFSFNTPLTAPEHQQCGRVVFSDIHVAAGDTSSPDHPFPNGCGAGALTDQEKALVFMLFDLSRCIVPDKKGAL